MGALRLCILCVTRILSFFANSQRHPEAYGENDIHIVYALEESLLPAVTVSVASIVESSVDPLALFFHFITLHLSAVKVTEMITQCVGATVRHETVQWKDIPMVIRTMKTRYQRRELAAPANYGRFYIGRLFPRIKRFIYLDTDTFVTTDIKDLWLTDIQNNVYGLRNNCGKGYASYMFNKHYNTSQPDVKKLLESNHSQCFPNAGVMIVNQKRFDEENILSKVEALIIKNSNEFVYNLGSQPLVILSAWDLYTSFPATWNYASRSGRQEKLADCCKLHHYTGSVKPWGQKAEMMMEPRILMWRKMAARVRSRCVKSDPFGSSYAKLFTILMTRRPPRRQGIESPQNNF